MARFPRRRNLARLVLRPMTMKHAQLLAGLAATTALLLLAWERDAAACGGCFHPPTQVVGSNITDERMLLSVSPTHTTLYDQIRYSGNPSSFAWVLPIHGTVEVGLSADVLFDSMDVLTATQIVAPPSQCPPPPRLSEQWRPMTPSRRQTRSPARRALPAASA